MLIRSYSEAFRQDRRIHRGYARHVPNGIPIAGAIYAFGLAILIFALDQVIVFHQILEIVSPFMRYVLLPIALAFLGYGTRIDDRPVHIAIWHLFCMHFRPARTVNGERIAADGTTVKEKIRLKLRADSDFYRIPRMSFTGPAFLSFGKPMRFRLSLRKRWVARSGGKVTQYALKDGERLEIKP